MAHITKTHARDLTGRLIVRVFDFQARMRITNTDVPIIFIYKYIIIYYYY